MRRLRIVRLLPVLDFGGVESRVALQAALIDRERFDLRVCTFWRDGEAARAVREAGIPVDVLGVDPRVRNPAATLALYRYLRRVRPDILHASISEGIYHGALAGALADVPVRIVEEVGIPSRRRLGRAIFGSLYHTVDAVIGVAQATCDILADEGVPPDRLRLVYNCAAPRYFPEPPRPRDYAGPLRVLAVGRLVPVKNHATLLRAFRAVVDAHPDARLSIAGDGPLFDATRALVAELGLEHAVELLGFRADVDELLFSHNCFVLPSWTEGCSISLIEAMASGLCVVGSTADGIREVLGGDGPNPLVPADDPAAWAEALIALAGAPPAERERRGRAAQRTAYERFSPDVYNRNVTELYLELAAARGARKGAA